MTAQIVAVLEYYGAPSVPRSTSWRQMRCPFHDDHHPSAAVSETANAFVCYACGVKGDAIKLLRDRDGLSYADAVRRAEEISGVSSNELSGFDYAGDFLPPKQRDKSRGGDEVGAWRSRVA